MTPTIPGTDQLIHHPNANNLFRPFADPMSTGFHRVNLHERRREVAIVVVVVIGVFEGAGFVARLAAARGNIYILPPAPC
jgi:hypothetical protein